MAFVGFLFAYAWFVVAVVAMVLWLRERRLHRSPPADPPAPPPPAPDPVASFLRGLEVHLRRLADARDEHRDIAGLLDALRRDHRIEPVEEGEAVAHFSDDLLQRYTLGEPLGDDKAVRVWEPYWRRGDEVLFKGTLRRPEGAGADE